MKDVAQKAAIDTGAKKVRPVAAAGAPAKAAATRKSAPRKAAPRKRATKS
jgi:ribosomal protein L12E/L44/L45/RPP1/RPP2